MAHVYDNCVLVAVDCRKGIGNTKKISAADAGADVDADKDWLKFRKALLDATELTAIDAAFRHLKGWLKEWAAPGEFFKSGCSMLNRVKLDELQTRYNEAQDMLATAKAAFLEAYPRLKEQAREKLGPLYCEDDYPPADRFGRKLRLRMRTVELAVPAGLPPAMQAEQRAALDADFARMREEVRLALRAGMLGIVEKAAERLVPDGAGEKKIIQTVNFWSLEKFLETFEARDITNDAEMKRLVAQARKLLADVDCDKIRTDEAFRDAIGKRFKSVAKSLDKIVEVQRTRLLELE